MSATTQVSVSEYLSTTYRPDCDYVDGEIVERNVGEKKHSRLQQLLGLFLGNREKTWNVRVYQEQRVQVSGTRFRIPDVCVTLADAPDEQIFTHPPFLCIEVLSKDDTVARMLDRIHDYLTMGVPHVWILDPESRRGYHYTSDGMREAKDGILRVPRSPIEVPIADLFD
jgi:Uma2 family endonuclease